MTTLQIPVEPVASQSVAIVLNNQKCIISLKEMTGRQYLSLSSNGKIICQNVLLQNNSVAIGAAYTGFVGEIVAEDLQGNDAPIYTGWGDRWVLLYNVD
jgi:hypothetical protein